MAWIVSVQGTAAVQWSVFTSAYRKVRTGTSVVTGSARFVWDLRDGMGRPVSNGTYYIRVVTGPGVATILKVLILR